MFTESEIRSNTAKRCKGLRSQSLGRRLGIAKQDASCILPLASSCCTGYPIDSESPLVTRVAVPGDAPHSAPPDASRSAPIGACSWAPAAAASSSLPQARAHATVPSQPPVYSAIPYNKVAARRVPSDQPQLRDGQSSPLPLPQPSPHVGAIDHIPSQTSADSVPSRSHKAASELLVPDHTQSRKRRWVVVLQVGLLLVMAVIGQLMYRWWAGAAQAPVFSPNGGPMADGERVRMRSAHADAVICYSTQGVLLGEWTRVLGGGLGVIVKREAEYYSLLMVLLHEGWIQEGPTCSGGCVGGVRGCSPVMKWRENILMALLSHIDQAYVSLTVCVRI